MKVSGSIVLYNSSFDEIKYLLNTIDNCIINKLYIIDNSENMYNLQMHYSNNYLDVMLGKNNFNGNDNLFCGIDFFLTNNFSINLSTDFSTNNFDFLRNA